MTASVVDYQVKVRQVEPTHFHVCIDCKEEYSGFNPRCVDPKQARCGKCLGLLFPPVNRIKRRAK